MAWEKRRVDAQRGTARGFAFGRKPRVAPAFAASSYDGTDPGLISCCPSGALESLHWAPDESPPAQSRTYLRARRRL